MMARYWWFEQINIVCDDVCESLFSSKAASDRSRGNFHKKKSEDDKFEQFQVSEGSPHFCATGPLFG